MNKYQEALDFLFDEAAAEYEFDEDCQEFRCLDCTSHDIYLNPVNILQELVDKRKPMKVKRHKVVFPDTGKYFTKFYTPCCGFLLGDDFIGKVNKFKYCPECGQALDWEEE